MRVTGIVLIIIGVVMLIFNGINYTTKKNVIDAGPIQVNKKENKHIGWPMYAGGIVAIVGLGLVIAGKKNK